MTDIIAFAHRLKIARKRTGKTQHAIGEIIGRSPRQISEWENGGGLAPMLQKLEELKIIRVLDADPEPAADTVASNDAESLTSADIAA